MNKILCLTLLFFFSLSSIAQNINRYFVYFTDKEGDNYPYSISNPSAFLTQKSIDRRNKQGIIVNRSDLPVHPNYMDGLRTAGAEVYFSSRWMNGALIQMDESQYVSIQSLSYVDSVALIAEDSRLGASSQSPSDPTEFSEPPLMNGDSDVQLIMLNADRMHAENVKGQNMLIAVLDNGYNGVNEFSPFQHLWENDRIIATKDFVQNSGNVFQFGEHGTSVLSIIGAKYETDSTDFYGVAYEASFVLCVTEEGGSEDRVEEYNWLLGAEFADSLGADVINSSLGYKTFDIPEHNYAIEDLDGETAISTIAATMAAKKGMIVAISAGNSGRSAKAEARLINHPSDAEGILTVGSAKVDFSKSDFSSIGPTSDGRMKPEIAAFGDATAIVRGDGAISRGSGTSFASPLIAGFAACIWQINPDWTSQQVIEALKTSAHKASSPDNLVGYGVPNYTYVIEGKTLNVANVFDDKVYAYPNPFRGDTLFLRSGGKLKKGLAVKIIDAQGKEVFNREYSYKETKEDIELTIKNSQQGVYYLFLQSGKEKKVVKLINF
jgi:serine protease AprX